MKATVAIYGNHEKAIKAVKQLVKKGINEKEISLVGKGEIIEDRMHINSIKGLKKAPVPIGVVAGGVLGVLAGAGMLAVPGLGFVFLAGKFVGALGGITMGMATGGMTSFLVSIGFKKDQVVRYKKHLEEGNFLVVINGPENHIELAHEILHTHADHLELH
ncbi:MAG: hypothetical protein CL840_17570 [Crocinitomicaceae bacterium]|nr:hypothetical protein [Crocinitomicaceae bacterium]|tara:strand:- start:7041 stop:7523 length:483 start_codon:yes stop_codon:yes gene_type:complete